MVSGLLARFAPRLHALLGARYGVVGLGMLLAALAWAGLESVSGAWLQAMQERSADWVWSATAKTSDERRLVIVDIDERSLTELGPWPWPRATQARLMQTLADAGVRQQVFDVVFSDSRPDDQLLLQVVQAQQLSCCARFSVKLILSRSVFNFFYRDGFRFLFQLPVQK